MTRAVILLLTFLGVACSGTTSGTLVESDGGGAPDASSGDELRSLCLPAEVLRPFQGGVGCQLRAGAAFTACALPCCPAISVCQGRLGCLDVLKCLGGCKGDTACENRCTSDPERPSGAASAAIQVTTCAAGCTTCNR